MAVNATENIESRQTHWTHMETYDIYLTPEACSMQHFQSKIWQISLPDLYRLWHFDPLYVNGTQWGIDRACSTQCSLALQWCPGIKAGHRYRRRRRFPCVWESGANKTMQLPRSQQVTARATFSTKDSSQSGPQMACLTLFHDTFGSFGFNQRGKKIGIPTCFTIQI